jgi:hypothetical protein
MSASSSLRDWKRKALTQAALRHGVVRKKIAHVRNFLT